MHSATAEINSKWYLWRGRFERFCRKSKETALYNPFLPCWPHILFVLSKQSLAGCIYPKPVSYKANWIIKKKLHWSFTANVFWRLPLLPPSKKCWKGTKSAIFTFDSSVYQLCRQGLSASLITCIEERIVFCILSSWNNANRLFLTFWSSEGPKLMAKILKHYLCQEIWLGFPSQAEEQSEKAELRGGADCAHVMYLSTTFLKKLMFV